MTYYVTVNGRSFEVEVDDRGVTVDGSTLSAEVHPLPEGAGYAAQIGSSNRLVHALRGQDRVWRITVDGQVYDAEVVDERTRSIRELTRSGAGNRQPSAVKAPMPGMVVQVAVSVGDSVAPDDRVAIVEAMKMENELRAGVQGIVSAVRVSAGQAVDKDQVLVEFEFPDADSEA